MGSECPTSACAEPVKFRQLLSCCNLSLQNAQRNFPSHSERLRGSGGEVPLGLAVGTGVLACSMSQSSQMPCSSWIAPRVGRHRAQKLCCHFGRLPATTSDVCPFKYPFPFGMIYAMTEGRPELNVCQVSFVLHVY